MNELDKDLYEILGIPKNAPEGDVRKAFLKLAKKYHPDVNAGNKEMEQRFKEINLAYEVLKDPKKRAQYDQMRAAGANPFARGAGGGRGGAPRGGQWQSYGGGGMGPEGFADLGLGDLFEEIFGGGFNAGRGSGRRGVPFQQRGADRETTLTIGFAEAAKGGERVLELSDGRRLTVKIPEGVDSGSKIKLAGQGDGGIGGAPAGDLVLTLQVGNHPYFQREGSDIIVKIPITFSEAVLGAEIEVPTLDNKVVMKLPKGVSSGQRLKLAGKGIRSAKTQQRGDQFVELTIKIPKAGDAEYEEAAKSLAAHSFNPRAGLF